MGKNLKKIFPKYEKSVEQVGILAFTPSSLIIPKHRMNFFLMRKKQFNGICNYFAYLLVCYACKLTEIGVWPQNVSQKWKKQYQRQGMDPQKISFVPDPCIWEAYRQISNQYGLSICHLFVLAMRFDYYDWLIADCPKDKPHMPVVLEFRKTLKKWPKKYKNFNITSFCFQKINFKSEILTRTGRIRK